MLLGVIAYFASDPRLTKKHFGLTAIENFIRVKDEYTTTPPFILLAEDDQVVDTLKNAFSDVVAKCKSDKLNDGVSGCASYLAVNAGETVKRVARESHSVLPQLFFVFSDENDKITQEYYDQMQWFFDFSASLSNPTALKHSIRLCINSVLEDRGVEFMDINSAYIDYNAVIGSGTVIYPNVVIEGKSVIGENCVVGMGCNIRNSTVGDNCALQYVFATDAKVGNQVTIGPFVNLRPNTVIADNCKIGDFVEVKNSNIGKGTKLPHLSYIGDADVGERVNVGCGTIFVNYDGKRKMRTTVGNDVFVGCNANLVAPVSVGNNAYIAAGSTITDDVDEGDMAIARGRQVNKKGWVPPYDR